MHSIENWRERLRNPIRLFLFFIALFLFVSGFPSTLYPDLAVVFAPPETSIILLLLLLRLNCITSYWNSVSQNIGTVYVANQMGNSFFFNLLPSSVRCGNRTRISFVRVLLLLFTTTSTKNQAGNWINGQKQISLLIIFVCVYGSTDSLSSNTNSCFLVRKCGHCGVRRISVRTRTEDTPLELHHGQLIVFGMEKLFLPWFPMSLNKSSPRSRLIGPDFPSPSSFLSSFFPFIRPSRGIRTGRETS